MHKYLLFTLTLAACVPTSQDFAEQIGQPDSISVVITGNDGAAVGQINSVLLTADNILECQFIASDPFGGAPIDTVTTFNADPSLFPTLATLVQANAHMELTAPGRDQIVLTTSERRFVIHPSQGDLFLSDLGIEVQNMINAAIAPETCFIWG